MNKTNYINLNEETENNFTLGKNNDIMKLYGRLKEISGRNKQNGLDTRTTVPKNPKIPDMWGDEYNGKSKNKRLPEHNKPHLLPYRPSEQGEPKFRNLIGKPFDENEFKAIPLHIPKEKKEQERLKRATGGYNLEKIAPEKIKEHLRLKEKTPDDYYSMSLPSKELDERLNKEALGPKTDFSVWNFENNYDKLNKEEQEMLIHKMQLAFNNEGYKDDNGYSLKTDGIFGNKTKSAYEKYKKNNIQEYMEAIENKFLSSEIPKEQKRNMLASTVPESAKLTLYSNENKSKGNSDANKKAKKTFRDWVESGEENKAELDAKKEKRKQELTDIITDIVETGNSWFKKLMPQTHDAGKQAQRSIWKLGAEKYLKDKLQCYTSAWMLEHSLQDNPEKVVRDNNSAIAYKINHSDEYLKALDEAIANSKDGVIDIDLENIAFSDRDLYFSLHKATIHVKGYKAEDGHWYISATLSDTYDFTEIIFLEYGMSKQKIIGALANDGAFISQLTDAITPYEVEVNFYTRR